MAEHGVTGRSQREQVSHLPIGTKGWMLAHHRVVALVAVVAVALAGVGLGVSLSTVVLLGIVLICPLMMLGMMVGMKGMHGGHQAHNGSDAALDVLRERYARGELTQDQYDRMRRDLG
jgi:uncharacterized membrane protein